MVLSQGASKYVNSRTSERAQKVLLADGPFTLADERQLQAAIWSQLGSRSNASAATSRFGLRISLEAETNLRQI
jgi:hypothetical protein